MQSILVLAVLALVFSYTSALDVTLNQDWKSWKEVNNKHYFDVEEHVRRAIWESNLKTVQEHNLKADLGIHTYWLGMNKYADMTIDEFAKMRNSYKITMQEQRSQDRHTFTFNPSLKLPDSVDWRAKGYVTPVQEQGQCGSDWAFSAVGAVEGQHFNATGKLVTLSVQNLVDCSGETGNMGCVGGTADHAFEYINKTGIDTEDAYPYEGDDNRCRFNPANIGAHIIGYTNITSKDENALQQAVATIGPISVFIDSSHNSFQLYKSGIYEEIFCSHVTLDLGVLVVGYGAESSKDYWIVKNNWGVGWGEQGYIRMSRNKHNQCGIATRASYPLV